ncbi:hypothetical protein ABT392_16695 [Paucibacter sp. JuS9]|uniref:hypothetical protein n=1 Tax=Paucibacter sp. JuS9 TaxID=3228748 RepID=UPI00375766BD
MNTVDDIVAALLERNACCLLEDRLWDEMPPIGHEFACPDFERLVEADSRSALGFFEPERRVGIHEGKLIVPESFDDMLPENVLRDFEGADSPELA